MVFKVGTNKQHTNKENWRIRRKYKAKPSHFFFGRHGVLQNFYNQDSLTHSLVVFGFLLSWMNNIYNKYWFIQIEISNWKSSLNRRLTKIIRSIIILIACGFPLPHLHWMCWEFCFVFFSSKKTLLLRSTTLFNSDGVRWSPICSQFLFSLHFIRWFAITTTKTLFKLWRPTSMRFGKKSQKT
jgi:hypothetical protein